MKVIFLDIDGVLVTRKSLIASSGKSRALWNQVDPDCVREFNRIIAETGAEIIISSSWRILWNTPLDAMLDFHMANIHGVVIGKTPRMGKRGEEIESCITPEMNWVILDDEISDIHLPVFQTSMVGGLTKEIADAVIEKLNAK